MGFPDLNVLDVFILVFVLAGVLRGMRTGFLAGAFSLVGVVIGAAVGSRLAPFLLPENEDPLFRSGITLASIVAFAVLGEVLARTFGGSLRDRLTGSLSATLDGAGGAALGLALSLTLVWVVGSFALHEPILSNVHPAVKESRVIRTLDARIPSELFTQAVARLDPLPQIQGPRAAVAEPDAAILRAPEVTSTGSRMVRVSGIACGYGVEGSGWVAAPDLVVTNAHVVAGEVVTRVQVGGTGTNRRARVVLFDDRNDIAVLRVRNLGVSPLPLAEPEPGRSAAVFGFPENGPLDVQPARMGGTRRVISTDAYDRGPVERTVTSFRAFVRPGNSGGPAVNAEGEVVATVFASRVDSSNAGFGIPSQIVGRHLNTAEERRKTVSTGECAN
ncbi:acid resistance serine protease MarP [soil metagenome]|nr:MarP family serine protease [Rubrobacter sp.]